MARQSWNPGYLFWLHTLIGVPIGAVAGVWSVASIAGSAAVVLASIAVVLVGATASAWRLPRIRDKEPAARLTWAIVGTAIGVGVTAAWAGIALAVFLHLACGSGGCEAMEMD